jgi:hypothetical protein
LIQEQRGSEKNKRWVTLAQETLDLPFLLYDESGFVTIYPKHAQIECDEKTNSLWSYPKEIQEKICTRYRISSNHFLDLLRPEIRVRFGCIYQDSTLYALGSLRVRLHEAALKFKTLNCFGSLKNEAQSKLFLANCHQDELLSRLEKHNILKILLGALIVAVCFTFLITFKK